MILAGIDEAGYGPLLGPLVVGCCAFEVAGSPGESLPCLWKQLCRIASKSRDKKGRKIHVNDSKLVYTPAAGLKELERSVLSLAAASGDLPETLERLLTRLAPDAQAELAGHPWYAATDDETFPIQQDGTSLRLLANAMRLEMQRAETRCVHLAARVVPERHLNRMLAATRNKSSIVFSLAAVHFDYLLRTFGQSGLVIYCDRQGGREHYGHLLRLMFEDWELEIVSEVDEQSEYRLRRGNDVVRVLFREKAESQCMSVAVASMISKYLREALMRRFNAWWRAHLPELEPTAGYYSDGLRFLRDIQAKRAELGVADGELIRAR